MKQVGILFMKLWGLRRMPELSPRRSRLLYHSGYCFIKELRHYRFQWHPSGHPLNGHSGRSIAAPATRTCSRARERAALPGSPAPLPGPTGSPGRRASAARLRMEFQETLAKRKRAMFSATMQTFAEIVIYENNG